MRGDSGRIVIEIDPQKKRKLYEVLDAEGITLKEWFLSRVDAYLADKLQPRLFSPSEKSGAE